MTPYQDLTFDTIINQFVPIIGVNGSDKPGCDRTNVTKILYKCNAHAPLLIFIIMEK